MRNTTISLGGGTYLLVAVGVGLAVSSWGGAWWWSLISGLFWPATIGYWMAQMLHKLAAS